MDIDMLTNYEQQNRIIKTYRWLKHIPIAYFSSIINILRWVINGCKPLFYSTRIHSISIIWNSTINLAHYKMGNSTPLKQYIAKIREQNDNPS